MTPPSPSEPGKPTSQRRYDPERRDRIISACLDVIAEHGLSGTSHRRVAAAADVPLGSMTYHFAGMEGLLREAFTVFADSIASRFEQRLAAARTPDEAATAVAAIIVEDIFATPRDLIITHELYTLAARDPAYRDLTTAWMQRSRTALSRHFDPLTAAMVDAVIEGLTIHRALDNQPRDAREVREAISRIVAGGGA